MENFYVTLGLPQTATLEEIKKRRRKLAKSFHPDTNPDKKGTEEKFKKIQAAYDVLSDSE
jgi:DnaJ-class molecular chaperone